MQISFVKKKTKQNKTKQNQTSSMGKREDPSYLENSQFKSLFGVVPWLYFHFIWILIFLNFNYYYHYYYYYYYYKTSIKILFTINLLLQKI